MKRIAYAMLIVLLVFSSTSAVAVDCLYFSGPCSWPCIPLIMDKIANLFGENAQSYASGSGEDCPDVLYDTHACGLLYATHWYGCPTSSGLYGKECDYDCDPPF